MHKILLTALVAAGLSTAGVGGAAAAAASALPQPAPASGPLVREAAIVCGGNGCNPVHTKAEKKRKFQTLGHG